MPKQEENIKELGFSDFKHGWIDDLPAASLPITALAKIQNLKFIGGEKENLPVCLIPRYGTSKVATDPLPTAQVCYAAYYFNSKYIAASNAKLYYWNPATTWVEIGNLDGKPTDFVVFNNKLIISDGGVTKVCDTSWNFNKLHNRYQNELVGTGDGIETDYNLDHFPIVADSQTITVNGVAQVEGTDYTINDTTGAIVFTIAPPSGHDVVATYLHENGGPKSKRSVVRKNRLLLTADPDNGSYVWYSGLNDEYAWNSDGISGVPDGGYETIGLGDGYSIKDFCLYFDKLYTVKEKSLYFSTFSAAGKISDTDSSISNIDARSTRCFDSADNQMFLVTGGGTFNFTSKIASISDFVEKISFSKGKNEKIHFERCNENSYSEYYPGENQFWVKMEGLSYILVSDLDGKWTKYKFLFDFSGFNYAPNGEMLICGSNGYVYKYDVTTCLDDGLLPVTFFYTSFNDFGSNLILKEANNWIFTVNNSDEVTCEISIYVDKSASKCYTITYDSVFTNLLITEDATMLTSEATFFTGDEFLERALFDGIFFRRAMVSVNLISYKNTDVVINGISFISRLIKE